jgi:hypothetical protein
LESKNKTSLSASRIKTAQSCSWLYWCKYHLKLPDRSNDGAKRGSICHLVFECLGEKRHKKHYDLIIKKQDIFASKAIERMVMKHARRDSVDSEDNIQQIKTMTLAGLEYDFFGNAEGKPTQALSEEDFDFNYQDDEVSYKIKGFIDKLFLYKKKGLAIIRDFKSSKEPFKGKEIENNLQDLMYALAVRKKFPEYKLTRSEFLFLKFLPEPKGVIQMDELTDEELRGFELELTQIQKYLDNFSIKDAFSDLAARRDYPKDNSFGGPLQCGRATHKGQLKKDGSVMYHCPYKFDFYYYKINDMQGNMVASCFLEDFDEYTKKYPEDQFLYQTVYYSGCPHFRKNS